MHNIAQYVSRGLHVARRNKICRGWQPPQVV